MSQELFVSVNQLIEMSEAKGTQYNHVVIESSGISEPKSVRSVFQDAESYEMQLMNKVCMVWTKVSRCVYSCRYSACSFGFFSSWFVLEYKYLVTLLFDFPSLSACLLSVTRLV